MHMHEGALRAVHDLRGLSLLLDLGPIDWSSRPIAFRFNPWTKTRRGLAVTSDGSGWVRKPCVCMRLCTAKALTSQL